MIFLDCIGRWGFSRIIATEICALAPEEFKSIHTRSRNPAPDTTVLLHRALVGSLTNLSFKFGRDELSGVPIFSSASGPVIPANFEW